MLQESLEMSQAFLENRKPNRNFTEHCSEARRPDPCPIADNVAACLAAFFEVALVVLLGAPEGLRGLDLGDDALGLEAALGGELLDLGAGLRLLLGASGRRWPSGTACPSPAPGG